MLAHQIRKSTLRSAAAACVLGWAVLAPLQQAFAQPRGAGVSLGAFYDTLSPYGDWIAGPAGRVWRPHAYVVGSGFQPYSTRGHWVYTDYGWSFESDFDWGWAPFHYGRWYVDPDYGWVWAPDTTWGPAWVDWREGGGYVGWAPLPPTGVQVVLDRGHPYWCFVPTARLVEPDVRRWSVASPRIHEVYRMTAANHEQISYSGARWYAGPQAAHIGAAAGRPIAPHSVTPPPPGRVQPTRSVAMPSNRTGGSAPGFGPRGTVAPLPPPQRVTAPGGAFNRSGTTPPVRNVPGPSRPAGGERSSGHSAAPPAASRPPDVHHP